MPAAFSCPAKHAACRVAWANRWAHGPDCFRRKEGVTAAKARGGGSVQPGQALCRSHTSGAAHSTRTDNAVVGQFHDRAYCGVSVEPVKAQRIQPRLQRVDVVQHIPVTRLLVFRQSDATAVRPLRACRPRPPS